MADSTQAACGGAATADEYWMRRALVLAQQSLTLSNPNPRVGCVIVGAAGQLLAQGYTQAAGGLHAEAQALAQAAAQHIDVRGASLYVTLEPCSHFGRTPPCVDAIVQAGIGRVIAAVEDPNPQVAGQGYARLRAAGIALTQGVLAAEARALNIGFFSRMQRRQPWLRLKMATSLDGFIALPNGTSQWITSDAARADGQAWRARACAVLTGVGTVVADDPLLNVRVGEPARQPHLLLLDSQLRTPPTARLLDAADTRQIHIFTCQPQAAAATALQARGAHIHPMPATPQGRVELAAVMAFVASELPCNELHIEAGAHINGAFLQANLVDEVLHYQAPKLLGQGLPAAQLPLLENLDTVPTLTLHDMEKIGPDVRLRLFTARGAAYFAQN